MAGEADRSESTARLRPSRLFAGLVRVAGASAAERSADALPEARLEDVEAYLDAFPSDDEDRTQANRDLRGDAGAGE